MKPRHRMRHLRALLRWIVRSSLNSADTDARTLQK